MRFKNVITILILFLTITFLCIGCSQNKLCKNIGNMNNSRGNHNSILLKNGKILLFGGDEFGDESIEEYIPNNNTFKVILKENNANLAKAYLLNNGNVLFFVNHKAFIFKYKEDIMSQITMIPIKVDSFVQLKDKTFLVSNGVKAGIYNAIKNKFYYVGDVKNKRLGGEFSLLQDGNVKYKGGSCLNKSFMIAGDELYNAKKQKFQVINQMLLDKVPYDKSNFEYLIYLDTDNYIHSSDKQIKITNQKTNQETIILESLYNPSLIKLKNGNILIVGGQDKRLCQEFKALSSIYLYKTKEKKLIKVGCLNHARSKPGLVQLKDGNILVTGGYSLSFNKRDFDYKKSSELILIDELITF